MSPFLPGRASGGTPDEEHPTLQRRPFSPAESRARWEVRAAQWRAREIAEAVFGRVSASTVLGLRPSGDLRGLLCLDVPWLDLDDHLAREAMFLAAAKADPILTQVPLVYVFAPESR